MWAAVTRCVCIASYSFRSEYAFYQGAYMLFIRVPPTHPPTYLQEELPQPRAEGVQQRLAVDDEGVRRLLRLLPVVLYCLLHLVQLALQPLSRYPRGFLNLGAAQAGYTRNSRHAVSSVKRPQARLPAPSSSLLKLRELPHNSGARHRCCLMPQWGCLSCSPGPQPQACLFPGTPPASGTVSCHL